MAPRIYNDYDLHLEKINKDIAVTGRGDPNNF
jgi:hypothetical protein